MQTKQGTGNVLSRGSTNRTLLAIALLSPQLQSFVCLLALSSLVESKSTGQVALSFYFFSSVFFFFLVQLLFLMEYLVQSC